MSVLRRCGKHIFGITIGLFLMAGSAWAADFQADVVQRTQGMELQGKIYVKAQKTRMDMNMMGRQTQTITRLDKHTVWVVNPGEGFYMEMPINPGSPEMFQDDKALEQYATKKKVGTETVNGQVCDKFDITYHDSNLGKMTAWVSQKLNFPIKMIQKGPYGESTVEYHNIQVGKVDDNLFELPAGLQKMAVPAMGGMMPRP
jgi:negative regulator of sigma E activity